MGILLKNLDWNYGNRKILDKVSIDLKKGVFYSIVGPNGSGKTTLLKNIARILEPKSNMVFIGDTDITKLKIKEIAQGISLVTQDVHIEFDFTVFEIVLMARNPYLKRFQQPNKFDIQIAKEAMLATNTWHLKDKNINEISGGEKQRVMVAKAIAQTTEIMLLDEPVSQLDMQHQVDIMDIIRVLVDAKNIMVVMVLHDLNLAAEYSDYIVLLNQGKIVMMDKPEKVITQENLKEVYNLSECVFENPLTGKPYVIPFKRSINKIKRTI